MSVREAESLVKKLGAEFNLVSPKPKKEKSRDLKRVEEELSDLLTAEVEVRVKKRVKRHGRVEEMGELAIQFGSLDELNGLIEKLRIINSRPSDTTKHSHERYATQPHCFVAQPLKAQRFISCGTAVVGAFAFQDGAQSA
jgi:hypothetical protein